MNLCRHFPPANVPPGFSSFSIKAPNENLQVYLLNLLRQYHAEDRIAPSMCAVFCFGRRLQPAQVRLADTGSRHRERSATTDYEMGQRKIYGNTFNSFP
ncbi:hypothetical protein GWI33_000400 [Rhynchophorus ferrugineus]|uniref:Uncharacterized protein n=1 Tax=Rhynchophorus ferrugineus TaxID=354439 RepID=A0A834IP04_RHYFE|nr:hypothetical protein GWI33_000400 [Rhynchophorus ferrugineus]